MWRSRHLDARLLAIAPALVVIVGLIGGTISIAFLVIGIWLVFGRHKSIRYFDKRLAIASLALAGYAFVRQMFDQNFVIFGEASCRNYFLLLGALPFVPVGIVLVRNPVAALSKGSRLSLGVLTVISVFWLLTEKGRLALDTNPLILAYLFALLACAARLPVRKGDKTGILWFYLALIPLAATGARIAIVFYVIAITIDIFKAPEITNLAPKLRVGVAAGFAILLLGLSTNSVMMSRVNQSVDEINNVLTGMERTEPLRFAIWRTAADAIVTNPVFGVGQCTAKANMVAKLNAQGIQEGFQHFHNMFFDIMATLGVVGFGLFAWFAAEVWRAASSADREGEYHLPLVMLFVMIVTYGMTGSLISDDRMIAATLLILGGIIKQGMMTGKRVS